MAAVSIGKGIADQAAGRRQQDRANELAAAIPRQDPGVASALSNIRQMRQYAESGMTRGTTVRNRGIENAGLQTQANMRRMGGSPGAGQQGLLRSQAQTQNALMQSGAATESMVPQLMAMETPLVSDMADRDLSLRTYERDREAFQGATREQQGNSMISGALGVFAGMDPSVWGSVGSAGGPAPGTGQVSVAPNYGAIGASAGNVVRPFLRQFGQ